MGIEHDQAAAVMKLFNGGLVTEAESRVLKGNTPNQRALGCAIDLGAAGSLVPGIVGGKGSIALFQDMRRYGHQATGSAGYSVEQFCPLPHSDLWMVATAFILSRAQRLDGLLLEEALDYFADHVALIGKFWTPEGLRAPCTRAKGTPDWSIDSIAYAKIMGLPEAGLGKSVFTGGLSILQSCERCFEEIRRRAATARPILGIPINKWTAPDDSFLATFVREEPTNYPCAWVRVAANGDLVMWGQELDTVPVGLRGADVTFSVIGARREAQQPSAPASLPPPDLPGGGYSPGSLKEVPPGFVLRPDGRIVPI